MTDPYQITPETATAIIPQKSVDPETLVRLKKRVEGLSHSVNLEAPEQFQSLQERYQFLSTQQQDLQKAKEDLKNAIQQINTTTRQHFKDTFFKVRENFIQIFSVLFTGGQADLVFTDEDNLLDTGIDIFSQPPGKKLQNIGLLSGGEKTLTAIALLFAFFMVKPSPICILDEVDAPLDVVNVGRFLALLKDFSEKTQFLVVTHNAKTMEMANILYGVTMEQAGISKILSAKLKKDSQPTPTEALR
jgi:chromosome segregation protein